VFGALTVSDMALQPFCILFLTRQRPQGENFTFHSGGGSLKRFDLHPLSKTAFCRA